MTSDKHAIEDWWDDHPLLKKFYVPTVLTATFIASIFDIFHGGGGK